MKAKFYNFNQNNSGGYFVNNDEFGVCEEIIIEANTPKEAINKFKSIGDNVNGFWSYCSCCGERWSTWIDESDGTETPEIYGVELEKVKSDSYRERTYVHYIDGTFKEFKHN